jgi:methionyl-tRNA formyltransferase
MSLKIIFMGTPQFAVPTLQTLLAVGYHVCAVYTRAPKPVGRGYHLQKSPVHEVAEMHGIPVCTPKSLRLPEEQQKFAEWGADLAVVVAYGLILPLPILVAPKYGCVNLHGSLLPRWRGAAPMQRCLLSGDQETGLTIMKMDEGLDTGPMIATMTIPLASTTTIQELHDQMAQAGAKLLVDTVPGYVQGLLPLIPQPIEGVTYADKLSKLDGLVDWRNEASFIERQVRALTPWPGVIFSYHNEKFKILAAEVVDLRGEPGKVLDHQLTIACGEKALRILKIQRSGGKPLETRAFLNGYEISQGLRLPCPDTN